MARFFLRHRVVSDQQTAARGSSGVERRADDRTFTTVAARRVNTRSVDTRLVGALVVIYRHRRTDSVVN